MNNQNIRQIAENLETLTANLETVTMLMLGADELGISAAKCAGLVISIQEQMEQQVNQLCQRL